MKSHFEFEARGGLIFQRGKGYVLKIRQGVSSGKGNGWVKIFEKIAKKVLTSICALCMLNVCIVNHLMKGVQDMKRFQVITVINSLREVRWYGESDSLRGAMLIASRHKEIRDRWQGVCIPDIYTSDTVREIILPDGAKTRVPKNGAECVAFKIVGIFAGSGDWLIRDSEIRKEYMKGRRI